MHWLSYIPWLLWQVALGAFDIGRDSVRTRSHICPTVVRYPLRVTSDTKITILSLSITMTPGTMTVGIEEDPDGSRYLLVHSVWGDDPESVIADIADMEARMAPEVKA